MSSGCPSQQTCSDARYHCLLEPEPGLPADWCGGASPRVTAPPAQLASTLATAPGRGPVFTGPALKSDCWRWRWRAALRRAGQGWRRHYCSCATAVHFATGSHRAAALIGRSHQTHLSALGLHSQLHFHGLTIVPPVRLTMGAELPQAVRSASQPFGLEQNFSQAFSCLQVASTIHILLSGHMANFLCEFSQRKHAKYSTNIFFKG